MPQQPTNPPVWLEAATSQWVTYGHALVTIPSPVRDAIRAALAEIERLACVNGSLQDVLKGRNAEIAQLVENRDALNREVGRWVRRHTAMKAERDHYKATAEARTRAQET